MSKYEQMVLVDVENFFALQFMSTILQFGVFVNIWFNQIGVL